MAQKQYAVGTSLTTPEGKTVRVADPNQFFSEGYVQSEQAPTVYGAGLQSRLANDAAHNTLYQAYLGRDAAATELGSGKTVGDLEAFLGGERTRLGVQAPMKALSDFAAPVVPEKPMGETGVPSGTAPAFTPPAPTAGTEAQAFATGVAADAANQRKNVEQAYKDSEAKAKTERERVQAEMDAVTAKEENALRNVDELTQPFREKLEKTERDRLKVEENFFANQASVGELESLMKSATAEIELAKAQTGLESIRNPRITKKINDYNARVGVVQAVMAARNSQISVAENLIDRTSSAINADRRDQLSYLDSVLNYYGKLKDDKGREVLALKGDEKKAVESQMNLIENDLAQADEVNQTVKKLMLTDPNRVDGAGITLNDSLETISKKLSDYDYKQEWSKMKNELVTKDYQYLGSMQEVERLRKAGRRIIAIKDSRGVDNYFAEPVKKATGSSTTLTTEEKAFGADLKKARADLASSLAKGDMEAWGRNFDYLKNQYDVPNDTLDELLNKEKYYPTE